MKSYKCGVCGIVKLGTTENFFPGLLKKAKEKNNINSLRCSECAKKYQSEYSENLKKRKLSRRRFPKDIKKKGTLYVIGPKNNTCFPFKIGITVGYDIKKRLAALQTAHWLELEIYYTSPLLDDVIKMESFLHNKYIDKKQKGEWFNIQKNDIIDIKFECEKNN